MLTMGTVGRVAAFGLLFGAVFTSGCSKDEEEAAPVAVVKAPPKPPKVTFEDKLEKAHALANAGKHDESVAALLPLLAEQPANLEVWTEVALQASVVEDPGALLDQLSADEAIGGQDVAHHTLRADLALAANRSDDALAAARLIAAQDAPASAALRALAVQAGAAIDRTRLDPENAADALILAQDADKAADKKTLLDLAATLDHWRVSMVLLPQYASLLGDKRVGESAQAVVEALVLRLETSDSLRAKLHGTSLRLEQAADPAVRKAEGVDGAKRRAAKATEAAKLANAHRLGGQVPGFLREAVDAYVQALQVDTAFELAKELDAARRQGEDPACDKTAVIVSNTARLAGDYETALAAGEQAFFGRMESAQRVSARSTAAEAAKAKAGKAKAEKAKGEKAKAGKAKASGTPEAAAVVDGEPPSDAAKTGDEEAEEAVSEPAEAIDPNFRRPNGAAKAWALAAAESCVHDDVEPALEALRAQGARVARALVQHCEGDFSALESLSVDAGSDWAWLVAVRRGQLQVGSAAAVQTLDDVIRSRAQALSASGGWAYSPRVIEAHLELERHARLMGDSAARGRALKGLQAGSFAETPQGDASVGVQSEVAVRDLMNAQSSGAPPSAVPSEILPQADWLALTMGTAAPDGATSPAAHWATARSELSNGNNAAATTAYESAFTSSLAARQGIWSPVLASDFADGLDVEAELARVGPADDARFVLHEWARHLDFKRMAARIGDNATLGMQPSAQRAVRLALARERTRTLLWLAGAADAPVEARKARQEAWAAAVGDCVLDYQPVGSLGALRAYSGDASVFSFFIGRDAVELMVVTPTNVISRTLAPSLVDDIAAYRNALELAASQGVEAAVLAGDRVRAAVFDPVSAQLSGPRYFMVAPAPLLSVPFQALPEQARGLRFFADIRRIGATPLVGPLVVQSEAREAARPEYVVDLLGIDVQNETPKIAVVGDEVARTMAAAGLSAPNELNSLTNLMGGGRLKILRGDEASTAAAIGSLPNARYVHVTSLGDNDSAGLGLSDGELSLGALRCGPVPAVFASLAAPGRMEYQLVRAICMINSGTKSVLVSLWDVPVRARYPFIRSTYAALGAEGAAGAAMVNGRKALHEVELDDEVLGPAVWGGFLLIGSP